MTRELTRPLPRTWWLQKAPYLRFMIRELTSVVVLAYALLLIWALWSAADSASFSAFLAFLSGPMSIGLHVVVLVLALYHTWTWIALTPKVMVLWKEDEQVEPDLIAGVTAVAFLVISGVVVWLVLL
jgi:fumarate reductase subunit C